MTRTLLGTGTVSTSGAHVSFAAGETVVRIDLTPHPDELRRRRRRGTGQLADLRLLNVLLRMPDDSPVPADSFTDPDWRTVLRAARRGAVDITDREPAATRRAAPPVTVRHVAVFARRWQDGLEMASHYAPYASRELVLEHIPDDDLALRLEADYLGIGVRERRADPSSYLVPPAPFTPKRFTAASWLFAERVLAILPQQAG